MKIFLLHYRHTLLFLGLMLMGCYAQAQTFRDVLDKGPAGAPVLPPEAAAQILHGNWQITNIQGAPPEVQEQLRRNNAAMQFSTDGTLRMHDNSGYTDQQWQWIEGGRMLQAYSRENPWGTGHIEVLEYQNNQLMLRITDVEHQQHIILLQRDENVQDIAPAEEKKNGLW